ncbi:MAG: DUF6516 family protein [Pseudomonadales bacterium]
MPALLRKHFKQYIDSRFVLEIKVWSVDDPRYTGVKYSMIFVEPATGRRILMDNHHPKDPHVHVDDVEFGYEFVDEDKLFSDFEQLIAWHFGVQL